MFGGNFIHQQIINLIIEKIEGLIAVVTDYPCPEYSEAMKIKVIKANLY